MVPARFRFLKFGLLGLIAWFFLIGLQVIKMGVCVPGEPVAMLPRVCSDMPAGIYYTLFAMIACSLLRMGFVAWSDHCRGAYAQDLAAGRDRHRGWWI